MKAAVSSIKRLNYTRLVHEETRLIHMCRRVLPWLADEQRSHLHPPRRPDEEVPVVAGTGTPDPDPDAVQVLGHVSRRAPPKLQQLEHPRR